MYFLELYVCTKEHLRVIHIMTIMCMTRKFGRLIEPGHRRVLFAVTRSNEPLETEHKLSESSMTRKTNTTMSG